MSSPYYTPTGQPRSRSKGFSRSVRDEFKLIEDAFNELGEFYLHWYITDINDDLPDGNRSSPRFVVVPFDCEFYDIFAVQEGNNYQDPGEIGVVDMACYDNICGWGNIAMFSVRILGGGQAENPDGYSYAGEVYTNKLGVSVTDSQLVKRQLKAGEIIEYRIYGFAGGTGVVPVWVTGVFKRRWAPNEKWLYSSKNLPIATCQGTAVKV